MRHLAAISAPLLPSRTDTRRSYARRQRATRVLDSLTCLVLFKHGENDTQLFVSDDGDAVGAVWINKQPLLVEPKDRGPFLVATLTRQMAQDKGLALILIDRERFTPAERVMLEDAVQAARRTRERMSGRSTNRPTWHGGRNVYA